MTQAFTHRFTEIQQPGGTLFPASRVANIYSTDWLDMVNHQRIVFLLSVGAMAQGSTVQLCIEQADINQANNTLLFPSGLTICTTALTAAAGDGNDLINVEVRADQMTSNYRYLRGNLVITGGAVLTALTPLRDTSGYAPVSVAGWTEIVAS